MGQLFQVLKWSRDLKNNTSPKSEKI